MIVGMRPPASGSATPAPDPEPAERRTAPEPDGTRRALRAARRRRRQLALVCALAIGVCLALTVLIVDLARDRAPSSTGGAPLLVAAASGSAVFSVTLPASITPDAAASEGGIR
jgi:hypothetical protein